jgi:hypothetical protein
MVFAVMCDGDDIESIRKVPEYGLLGGVVHELQVRRPD